MAALLAFLAEKAAYFNEFFFKKKVDNVNQTISL
jgi:hypothetical protein